MAFLAEVYTHLRIFVSYGPGLAFLLFLHEAIRLQRPDMVDRAHRVRNVDISELLSEYGMCRKVLVVIKSGICSCKNLCLFRME